MDLVSSQMKFFWQSRLGLILITSILLSLVPFSSLPKCVVFKIIKSAYHLSNRTKNDQNGTKSGPLFRANPDIHVPWIRTNTIKSDFYRTSLKILELFHFAKHLLYRWIHEEKKSIFSVNSSIFHQIRTILCKSGPFPDQFPEKSPEKTDQMGALLMNKTFFHIGVFGPKISRSNFFVDSKFVESKMF